MKIIKTKPSSKFLQYENSFPLTCGLLNEIIFDYISLSPNLFTIFVNFIIPKYFLKYLTLPLKNIVQLYRKN